MTRLEQDERHANYYGFANWASGYLFDLKTGDIGSGGLQEEIATYVAAQESALGLTPLFDATLTASNAKRKQYDAARAALVDALMEVADPALSPAQVDALEPSIVAASQAVAQRDAELLLVELGYYLGLYQATQQAGSTNLAQYLACIESPATQAMKGNGGFDALGGGTCEP
jgi:hypothetical protein